MDNLTCGGLVNLNGPEVGNAVIVKNVTIFL